MTTIDTKSLLAAAQAASIANKTQQTDPTVSNVAQDSQETQQQVAQAQEEVVDKDLRVFYGELPQSVSMMTPQGTPVYFYAGFHVTKDPEVIDFLSREKNIKDVTGKIKLSDIPKAPVRTRSRNWHAASKFGGDPSVFSPAELLQRAVAGSNTLTTAAHSNTK